MRVARVLRADSDRNRHRGLGGIVNTRLATEARSTRFPPAPSAVLAAAAVVAASGCLNTRSVAFQHQPAAAISPPAACREAAVADGWSVIEVTDVREVDEGYWEARFVLDDPEVRNLMGCRHSISGGFTEVYRLDG